MKASSHTRVISILVLTAFILIPSYPIPSSEAESTISFTYRFDFSEPYVDLDTPDRLFAISGLELDGRGGVPALPVCPIYLAIPPGFELVDIEVRCTAARTIAYMESYPTNPTEITMNGERSFSHDYQVRWWEKPVKYTLEGVDVLCLDLRPLLWERETGSVSFAESFSVTLVCDKGNTTLTGDMDRVRELVDNPLTVPDHSSSYSSMMLPYGDYDHLIITSEELSTPFLELARWKGERGQHGSVHDDIGSVVVTIEEILGDSRFWGTPRSHGGTGNDTQTIVRNFVIAAHREWGIEYLLIGGDDEVIPTRMVKAPISDPRFKDLAADMYYSGLDGDWDTDGDGIYGELLGYVGDDEADLLAEVFVGRATVSTLTQAWNFVNKTIAYERGYSDQYGSDLLLIGEKLDERPTYGDDYKNEVYDQVLADEGLDRTTIYARDGTFSKSAVMAGLESNVHVVNHMGHGTFQGTMDLTNYDVRQLNNDRPFILYTQACMVAGFDTNQFYQGDCIAEEFIQGEAGAVALVGNSRYGWYSPGSTAGSSQKFDLSFFSQVYDDNITELGRALSYSKEEWAASAGSASTMRWVYLELNLLGDPETKVHVPGRELHDLAVQMIDADRAVFGEMCSVSVRVQNLGQSDDAGTLRLYANGREVGVNTVSLAPGESATMSMGWIPSELVMTDITAKIECALDQRTANDLKTMRSMVDRRVVADEIWTGDRTMTGGLLIDPCATVYAVDCVIELQPSHLPYRITVLGGLSLEGSSVEGSPFFVEAHGGNLELLGSSLFDMSNEIISVVNGGSLVLRDTAIKGGAGWLSNSATVLMRNVTLMDQRGEWHLSNSTAELDRVIGNGGKGILLWNMTGSIIASSWIGGTSGLSIHRCVGLTLRDLSFLDNGVDMGVFGDSRAHFEHDTHNVSLTRGPLQILNGSVGVTVENATGSLYLIGCHDVVVRSSLFGRSGNGLAMIDSSGIEIIGNVLENCTAGILAIDSDGTVWGNDLLDNDRQAALVRSNITFGKGYPIGGNHWSDKTGTDSMGGEDQDETGPDGMFDTAYDRDGIFDWHPKVGKCSLVLDQPKAAFSPDDVRISRVDEVIFTSIGRSGIGIANWTWDLGDGHRSYGESTAYTYPLLGTFDVALIVIDHYGRADIAVGVIAVNNLEPTCEFDITPVNPAPGENVHFHDMSSDLDGDLVSWTWDFGDGGTSTETSPDHVYANEGTYQISLTLRDSDGATVQTSRLLAVGNEPPNAAFSWSPHTITTTVEAVFTSQSTDPDGTVVSWTWNLGDGSLGNGSVVRHTYTSLGTYTVTLTVMDENGATSVLNKTLTVVNSRPVASFSVPTNVDSLLDIQFNDSSYDLDGSIRSWSWNFGDGGTSNERSPTHTYLRPGSYAVELVVTDDRGWTGRSAISVTVNNRLPEVNVTIQEGVHYSLDVLEFRAVGHDPDGMVATYVWDMGDGSVLEGAVVVHAFLAPGKYTVIVTCHDDSGGSATNDSEILIHNIDPRASVLVERGDHPLEVVLTALAEDIDGAIEAYNWSFGDGTFGAGPTIVHRYQNEGSYDIALNITDDAGGAAEVRSQTTVGLSNIILSRADLIYDDIEGWTLSGEIINDGAVPVRVTLHVDAGAMSFQMDCDIAEGSSTFFDLPLTDFKNGNVTVKVTPPNGWDSNLQDNQWTTYIEREDTFPYWLVGLAIVVMTAIIAAMFIRRKE